MDKSAQKNGNLENIEGDFRKYGRIIPGTLRHVDELMQEGLDVRDPWAEGYDHGLRGSYIPADGFVYSLERGMPTLRITRETANPLLKHIDTIRKMSVLSKDYAVSTDDFNAVKDASDTVTIDLTKIRFSDNHRKDGNVSLDIDPSRELSDYNSEEQKLLLRILGPTEADYEVNMARVRDAPSNPRNFTLILLAPDYIKAKAKEGPIARPSWLNTKFMGGGVQLGATCECGLRYDGFIRGVRQLSTRCPSMEEILEVSKRYVMNNTLFEEEIEELYYQH
ncbi:MAG: hypothetical protein WCV90_04345 [Candidatus Woesearchaeota archaeon]